MTHADTQPLRLAYSASQHRHELEEADDRTLLAALVDGDEDALDELIGRKTAPLVHLARRILGDAEEARDVVQMTFVRMWERREDYDPRWAPNTWIYRIATNLAIDHLRSQKSRQRHDEPYKVHLREVSAARGERHLAEMAEGEVGRIFAELADELTDKQRAIFLLREVEGMSSKEVAQIVDCRESTVRNHLFNARKVLRQALIERYPEYAGPYAGEEVPS